MPELESGFGLETPFSNKFSGGLKFRRVKYSVRKLGFQAESAPDTPEDVSSLLRGIPAKYAITCIGKESTCQS